MAGIPLFHKHAGERNPFEAGDHVECINDDWDPDGHVDVPSAYPRKGSRYWVTEALEHPLKPPVVALAGFDGYLWYAGYFRKVEGGGEALDRRVVEKVDA